MNRIHKRRIKQWLDHAGISVRSAASVRPVDYTAQHDPDPVAGVYAAGGRSVLLRVPLARCRHLNWHAYSCTSDSPSPFIQTLLQYQSGACTRYADSPLARFYLAVQPQSAAEHMGLSAPSFPELSAIGPGGAIWPWRPVHPAARAARRELEVTVENREHGARFGFGDGDPFYGPVSQRKGELEFRRLIRAFENIKRQGFRVDPYGLDNITVTCLYPDEPNNRCYVVASGGQHRLAALTALGHEDVVVQLSPEGCGGIIRAGDAEHWPAVRSGYLTIKEATGIFNRLIAG